MNRGPVRRIGLDYSSRLIPSHYCAQHRSTEYYIIVVPFHARGMLCIIGKPTVPELFLSCRLSAGLITAGGVGMTA